MLLHGTPINIFFDPKMCVHVSQNNIFIEIYTFFIRDELSSLNHECCISITELSSQLRVLTSLKPRLLKSMLEDLHTKVQIK